MNNTIFFSVVLSSVLFFFIRFISVNSNRTLRSDVYYFLLCSEFFKKQKKIPFTLPSYYTMEYRTQYYPPIFTVFLSLFSIKFLKKYHHLINHIIDFVNVFILSLFCYLTFEIEFYFFALTIILYAFQTSIIAEFTSLTSRPLGLFLFNLTIFPLFLYIETSNIYFFFISIFPGVFLVFTHKLTLQLLFFLSLLLSVFYNNFLFSLLIPSAYFVAFILYPKMTYCIIKGHIDIVKFWTRNSKFTGNHPIYDSSIFKQNKQDLSENTSSVYFKKFTILSVTERFINFLKHNLLFPYFLFNFFFDSILVNYNFKFLEIIILGSYFFGLAIHFLPFLRGIGLGYQYFKFTVLPSIIYFYFNIVHFNDLVIAQKLLISLTILIIFLNYLIFYNSIKFKNKDDTPNLIKFLTKLKRKNINPKKKIFCLPYSITDATVYYLRSKVLWGTHGFGFKISEKIFPVLKISLNKFFSEENVSYLFLKKDFCNLKNAPKKIILQDNNYIFYEIQKKEFQNIAFENKKKEIVFIIGSLNIGGTEKHLVSLANNIDKSKYKVSIFLINPEGILINELDKNIKILSINHTFKSKKDLLTIFLHLIKYISRESPHIVHCFLPLSYLLGGFAALLSRKSNVIMSRRSLNYYRDRYKFPILKLEKYLHKYTNIFLVNSKAIKQDLIAENVNPKKIKLIYNGILFENPKQCKKQIQVLRNKLNIKNEFVFLTVANFIPYKNHKLIINASKELFKHNKNFKVIFVGGGGEYKYINELKNLVRDSGLSNVIIFENQVANNIINYFYLSNVGISSSNEEGFSNSVIEYLYCGLPVIATNVGGNPEAINKNNGVIIARNNKKQLTSAMHLLASNKKELKRLSINAKKDSLKYSFENMIKEYENVYKIL